MLAASVVFAIGALLGSDARAVESEPVLFLGVQNNGKLDKVAAQSIEDSLQDRGENVLHGVPLTEADRRCRRVQCLVSLSTQRHAALVLSGDVQPVAPGASRNVRVIIHLFDGRSVRSQGASQYVPQDAAQDMESLCTDCDDTKLGIVLTTTTGEILSRLRQQAVVPPPLPAPAADPGLTTAPKPAPITPPPVSRPTPPSAVLTAPPPVAKPTPPSATLPAPAPPPVASPVPQTGFPSWETPPVQAPVALPPPPPAPAQSLQAPLATSLRPDLTQQTPTQGPLQLPAPPTTSVATAPAHKGLSSRRKGVAAAFGVLGFGTLVASAILTGLDKRIDTNYTLNNLGAPCSSPDNQNRNCVFSFVRLYAPGYAIGGLLVGGMILTLTLPEKNTGAQPAQ